MKMITTMPQPDLKLIAGNDWTSRIIAIQQCGDCTGYDSPARVHACALQMERKFLAREVKR